MLLKGKETKLLRSGKCQSMVLMCRKIVRIATGLVHNAGGSYDYPDSFVFRHRKNGLSGKRVPAYLPNRSTGQVMKYKDGRFNGEK